MSISKSICKKDVLIYVSDAKCNGTQRKREYWKRWKREYGCVLELKPLGLGNVVTSIDCIVLMPPGMKPPTFQVQT
jgi:hypothetical protein